MLLLSCSVEPKTESLVPEVAPQATLISQIVDRPEPTNQPKVYPDDVGWVNVKQDFGAKGDGVSDDTQAILNAIAAAHNDYTRPKLIYFPAGTYVVSDTLEFPMRGHSCCITFRGQGKDQTIIRLQDKTPGFARKDRAKAVIKTKQGNAAFRNYIQDLTISVGQSNPGAIGIDYVSSNRGGIINVAVKSEDGQGKTGIAMIREWPGPSLIKNVEIEGFDYGIHTRHRVYGITLEHIKVRNQRLAGILNEANSLAIRGLESVNTIPAVVNKKGLVIALEGRFAGGAKTNSAIDNQGYFYGRDLQAEGYQSAIKNNNQIVPGLSQAEYISDRAYNLFDSPAESLKLPIKETPDFHDSDLDNWANVRDYDSIQAAMDSGKSTIYFPMGMYKLNQAVNIPATVKRIIGFESFINLNQRNLRGSFVVSESSKSPLIIEGFLMDYVSVDHLSTRPLAIKHSKIHKQAINNAPNSGDLFLEDVQLLLNIQHPQNVWARQLNPETLKDNRTKVMNPGGRLWILGLKTEGKGTVIETTKGGKTELLGTLIYPVNRFTPAEANQAAFINQESEQSLIYSVSASQADRNYTVQIRETRNGVTKEFKSKEMPRKTMPLFVGHKGK